MRRFLTGILVLVILAGLIAGCSQSPAAPAASPQAPAASQSTGAPASAQSTTAPAAAASSQASAAQAQPAPTGKPIKIAYVSDMTGVFADYSVPCQYAMEIALDEINKSGGILGRPVEMTVRDSKGKPDVGLTEARDVIQNWKADFLTGACSGAVTLAMAEFAEQNKVIHLAYPTGTNVQYDRFNKYLFMISTPGDTYGMSVATYLADLPMKNYYVIGSDYVYGHQLLDAAWGKLTKLRPDIKKVGESWSQVNTSDFTPYVTTILSAKPEAVLAALPGIDDTNFIKTAAGYGYFDKTQHVTIVGGNESSVVPFGKEFPKGIIGGSVYAYPYTEKLYPNYKAFNDEYNKRAGDYKYFFNTATMAYDAIKLLAKAITDAGSTDSDKVLPYLEKAKVEGTRGMIEMNPVTHRMASPFYVGKFTNSPDYPFAVMENVKEYRGPEYSLTDDQIKNGWKK